jgi:1,4-dihydroxy-2-naphthoate octaprenyltransferase
MMEMQTVTVDPASAASIARPKLQDIEAQIDPEEDEETRKNKEMKRTLATRVIQGSAVACMVLNLIAMIIEWSGIMATAGIVGICVAGGVVYFQNELRNEDSKYL